jgi:putative Holliday junction resolvase
LDIGERRVGLAHGDTLSKTALPLCVLSVRGGQLAEHPGFRQVIADYEPELLVVGLPLSLDGGEGPQAKRVRRAAEVLAASTKLPIIYQDERLSSVEAKRSLREAGCTEREMRGKIDMVAAALILRSYLESVPQGK